MLGAAAPFTVDGSPAPPPAQRIGGAPSRRAAVMMIKDGSLCAGTRQSFWDAMIIRSAQELGCQTLYSEDLNPGQAYAGVRVSNPFLR
jgi:hypothetical protein